MSTGSQSVKMLVNISVKMLVDTTFSTHDSSNPRDLPQGAFMFCDYYTADHRGSGCAMETKNSREQGWCSGEGARLPPMCPGFDSWTQCHTWAEFVGSLLCSERFFSGYSGFPLSSKTNI